MICSLCHKFYLQFSLLQIKEEQWWLVLGNTSTSELYALKRVSVSDHLVTSMKLPLTPANLQVNRFCSSKLCSPFSSCTSCTHGVNNMDCIHKKHNFSHICFQQGLNEVSTICIPSARPFNIQNGPGNNKGIMSEAQMKIFNHHISISTYNLFPATKN